MGSAYYVLFTSHAAYFREEEDEETELKGHLGKWMVYKQKYVYYIYREFYKLLPLYQHTSKPHFDWSFAHSVSHRFEKLANFDFVSRHDLDVLPNI